MPAQCTTNRLEFEGWGRSRGRDPIHEGVGGVQKGVCVRFEPIQERVKLRIKGEVCTAEDIARSPILSKEAAAGKASRAPAP